MSDKKRRSKSSGAKKRPAAEPAKAEPKVSLPAFGFAEDLLAAASGGAAPSTGEAAEAKAASRETSPDDPERIFAFADGLAAAGSDPEPEATPVRLATFVTFDLAGETFALPVEPVSEVLRVHSITRVPHAPEPIRGVTNVRGRVIPVIDLRLRIGLEPTPLDRSSRVIVVGSRRRLLGLLADSVHQVVHLDLNRVQPPPDDVMTVQSDYISGVYHLDERLILLLDVDRAMVVKNLPAAGAA